jgi:chromosome segregation ATPase
MSEWEIDWKKVAQEAEQERDTMRLCVKSVTRTAEMLKQERDQARKRARRWKDAARYERRLKQVEAQFAESSFRGALEQNDICRRLKQELAEARQEAANLQRRADHAAQELEDALDAVEAVRKENEQLRRQVAVLVDMARDVQCSNCDARDLCDNKPAAMTCEETIREWAAQQAKEGGGK